MKVTLPLILPGVISGGLFAFVTSFDEVVVVLFLAGLENTTIPIQMWTGLREQLSPTILAVATCLIVLSTLILPGVISGGLFAFVTSFDEVVVVLFLAGLENTTIPVQMWTGLREQLSPTILAVATCLIVLSVLILVTAELLRRRSERLRGINR